MRLTWLGKNQEKNSSADNNTNFKSSQKEADAIKSKTDGDMEDLKNQIADLRNKLASNDTKRLATPTTEVTNQNSKNTATSNFTSNINNGINRNSGDNSNQQDNLNKAIAQGLPPASAIVNIANDKSMASASLGTGSTSAKGSKASSDKVSSGILLSASGDVVQDQTNIIDNPKDSDLNNLIVMTKGKPFLIREDGVLKKVSLDLTIDGKPKLINGKLIFKKEKISEVDSKKLALTADKNANENVIRQMKEVDSDPTRLLQLKDILNQNLKQ